ncbi:adenosylhomocysteinase [Saccharopolyspora hordei]|uniref:adenosylhomocysteinase n=1 Tax=Saccharopolyspora hordei TaxID=1838 RepID=UPI001C53B915
MPLLRDPALADDGAREVEFAHRRMPVLAGLTERWEPEELLRGARIAACSHATTETANLCRALVAGRRCRRGAVRLAPAVHGGRRRRRDPARPGCGGLRAAAATGPPTTGRSRARSASSRRWWWTTAPT